MWLDENRLAQRDDDLKARAVMKRAGSHDQYKPIGAAPESVR